MKIALVTDLHFGVHRNSETHLESQKRFFYGQLIPYLKDSDIKNMIIPGDIFDSRNTINVKIMNEVYNLFYELDQMLDSIMVIVGNHDLYYTTNSQVHSLKFLEKFNNIQLIENPTTVKYDEYTSIFAVPWVIDEHEFVKEVKKTDANICIGHFEIAGFRMNNHKVNELGLSKKLFGKFERVFSGHFHLTDVQKSKGSEIVYIGSPYAMDRGDMNESKGFMVLDAESKNYDFVNNNVSLKYVKVNYPQEVHKDLIEGNVVDVYVNYDEEYKEKDFQKYIESLQKMQPMGNVNVKIVNNFLSGEEIKDLEDFKDSSVEHMMEEYVNGLELKNESEIMNILKELAQELK